MHQLCLDLDNVAFNPLKTILKYIISCPYSRRVKYRSSSCLDGYHVVIDCEDDSCDYCKRRWDDWRHYFNYRWGSSGDPLFDRKPLSKGGKTVVLEADIWVWVKW